VRGRLFASVALLCLMGFIGTMLLWARSFLPADLHTGVADGRLVLLFSSSDMTNHWKYRYGRERELPVRAEDLWRSVRVGQFISPERVVVLPTGPGGALVQQSNNPVPQAGGVAGVQWITEPTGTTPLPYRMIVIPLLYMALPLAVPPALWLALALRRRRRLRAGLCRNCGYDLRGTPGRCPECGTDVAADSVAAAPTRQAAA